MGVGAEEVFWQSDAEQNQNLAAMRANGITELRQIIRWSTIESVQGALDWHLYDRILVAAARHNMRVLPIIGRSHMPVRHFPPPMAAAPKRDGDEALVGEKPHLTRGKYGDRCARSRVVWVMRHLSRARVVAVLVASVCCSALAVPVAEASFPGRNGRIAYHGEIAGARPLDVPASGLYAIRPDGTGRRVIVLDEPFPRDLFTPAVARYSGPAYPPGGARIAYVRSTPSALGVDRLIGSIWIARSDGSHPRELISAGPYGSVSSPHWAPDGQAIVFSRDPCAAYNQGDQLDCPPEVSRPSDDGLFVYRRGRTRLLTHHGDSPSWSPSGRLIAFLSEGALYVIRPDGSHRRRVFNKRWVYSVDWSPNGLRLVFDHSSPTTTRIATIRPNGRGFRQLTRDGQNPAYSPDGRQIAYARAGGSFLMTMRADGTGQRRIRPPSGKAIEYAAFPAWQPLPE